MTWILSFLLSVALAQDTERVFAFPLFTEGLHTRYSGNAVPDQSLTKASNVLLDEDVNGVIVARRGYAKYNSTPLTNTKAVRGLWSLDASDGTKYLIAVTSAAFYKTAGDGTWTAITGASQFSSINEWDCVQTLGRLWCANGQTVFSYDGTSTHTITTAPAGTLIDRFRNRVWKAGISGQKGRLRGSGELDGTDWTAANLSTSATNIAVGGVDDGQEITCLMGVYQDVLMIGKQDSLWGLYGFDRRDFALREISREVGCIEDRSVQEKNNCLYWLSKRGLEKYCGTSITRISDPIRDQLDTIIATAGNARSVIDTAQSDFELGQTSVSGPTSKMSTALSPGNVVPSSWSITETAGSQFVSGTLANTSTSAIPGAISFIQGVRASFPNAGAEQNVSTNMALSSFARRADTDLYGSYVWREDVCSDGGGKGCPEAVSIIIADTNLNTLISTQVSITDGLGSTTLVMDTSGLAASSIRLRVVPPTCSPGPYSVISSTFIRGTDITIKYKDGAADASCLISFDLDETSQVTSGTYTSKRYDSTFSTPTWGLFSADMSSGAGRTLDFVTRVDPTGSAAQDASVSVTNNVEIGSAQKEWISYLGTFTVTATTAPAPYASSVELAAKTTGYFISQCRNPGTAITQWRNFQCNFVTNGGDFTFYVSTGATCNGVTRSTANWVSQSNSGPISLATAPFIAYRTLFDLDVGTENPTLQDCTISWVEGDARPPLASAIYRDRYYLSYTSSTAAGSMNDHQLVLDKNDKWTIFDDHFCYSMSIYNRKLYCGASTNSGQVWQQDTGTDDDGASYTSIVRTKAYSFTAPEYPKKQPTLYLDLEPEPNLSDAISMTARYYVDRGTTPYSFGTMDMGEDPGHLLNLQLFPQGPSSFKYIEMEFETSGRNQPWRLYGGRLYYRLLRRD